VEREQANVRPSKAKPAPSGSFGLMALDIANLKDFYDSPLGEVTRHLDGRVIITRWTISSRLTIGALRYELPYLDRFHDKMTAV
jgi:hypothetical protein